MHYAKKEVFLVDVLTLPESNVHDLAVLLAK